MAKAARKQNHHNRENTVKKTITIIRYRDVPASHVLSMAAPANTTDATAVPSEHAPWLWIPYVLIALVFIVFLGANFWCYHKKHRERYLRKREETRVKEGLLERRRIAALVRSHFQAHFLSPSLDSCHAQQQTTDEGAASAEQRKVAKQFSSPERESDPILDQWAGQNGLCRTLSMCAVKSES